jgi:uncharacterized protein YyaL (SSP411 family)
MTAADFRFSPRPNRAREIHWRAWGDDVFKEAQDTKKPVLLSLSAVWCHWCHVMDETTYSDRRVIEFINNRFIPTRVDNDRRPDVNRRYNMGGWPTTAFLTETGDVITGATYLPAEDMLGALRKVDDIYSNQRAELVQRGMSQRAQQLSRLRAAAQAEERRRTEAAGPELDAEAAAEATAEAAAEAATEGAAEAATRAPAAGRATDTAGEEAAEGEEAAGPRSPLAGTLVFEERQEQWAADTVQEVEGQAKAAFDPVNGGFGGEPKFPQAEVVSFLLLRAAVCDDERLDEIVTKTLDAMADGDLYDRAEDGFFRYATQRDWTVPHYEKMLEDNAKLALVYLDAALRYPERERYRDVAAGVIRYLTTVLWLPNAKAFAGSQDADEHYYSLDLDGRHDLTAPFIDPTVYVDWNARVAQALIRAAVVLERPELAQQAIALLDGLWDTAHGRHGMVHYLTIEGGALVPGPVDGMLGDQAHMAEALLDAYEWSGQRTYLARAEVLADWVEKHLGAPGGSLFDRVRSIESAGLLALPRVAFDESAAMADAWLRLGAYSGEMHYRQRAGRVMTGLGRLVDRYGLMAAGLASTLLRFLEPQVHVAVVGPPDAPETRALLAAALRVAAPQRTVQVLDPDADTERLVRDGFALDAPAQAYVCRGVVCLPPTTEPADIAGLAKAP